MKYDSYEWATLKSFGLRYFMQELYFIVEKKYLSV